MSRSNLFENVGIERDYKSWIETKLAEEWSSENIGSLWTTEALDFVKKGFNILKTNIKIRILFSFFVMRKNLYKQLENDIKFILELAEHDDEEWVIVSSQMVSELLLEPLCAESPSTASQELPRAMSDIPSEDNNEENKDTYDKMIIDKQPIPKENKKQQQVAQVSKNRKERYFDIPPIKVEGFQTAISKLKKNWKKLVDRKYIHLNLHI